MSYFTNGVAVSVGTDIYIFGGTFSAELLLQLVLKYDTVADTWEFVDNDIPVRCHEHSVSLLNGLVYVVGGGSDGKDFLSFDPATLEWVTLPSTVTDMRTCTTFVLDGSLYAAGGGPYRSSDVDRYDLDTGSWTRVANMSHGRSSFQAVIISTHAADEVDIFDSLIEQQRDVK
jgi:hypothetical protein